MNKQEISFILENGILAKTKDSAIFWVSSKDSYTANFRNISITLLDNRGYCDNCCESVEDCTCPEGTFEGNISLELEYGAYCTVLWNPICTYYSDEYPILVELLAEVKARASDVRSFGRSDSVSIIERFLL